MRSHVVSDIIEDALFPEDVFAALVISMPDQVPSFAQNPWVPPSVWRELVMSADADCLADLLHRPLVLEDVLVVADLLGRSDPGTSSYHLLDRALARFLLHQRWSVEVVMDAAGGHLGPSASGVAASLCSSVTEKLRFLPAAHMDARCEVLLDPSASTLSDEEVMSVLGAPLPDDSRSAQDEEFQVLQVLLRRPSLWEWAAQVPALMEVAAHLPLSPEAQGHLVEHMSRPSKVLLPSESLLRSAWTALVSSPWSTRETVEAAFAVCNGVPKGASGVEPYVSKEVLPLDLTGLSWRSRRRLVRLVFARPLVEMSRAASLVVVARRPLSFLQKDTIRVALRTPASRSILGPLAVELACELGAPPPAHVPPQFKVSRVLPALQPVEVPNFPTLEEVSSNRVSFNSHLDREEVIGALRSLGNDVAAWEMALTLLGDGFEGTLGDLVEGAKNLTGR